MKNFKKKAFTLVELLVVIAIIAILAVAGVVGYMAFTKKAEVTNDTSLVAELNNYVAAMASTDKINTPTDVRNALVEDGIDLATLKLSAEKQGYAPGFNVATKRFVLLKEGNLAEGYSAEELSDVFAFAKNEAEATTFMNKGLSLYLQSGYDKTTINVVGVGVDVGANTSVTTVNYTGATSANDVIIRTNGAGSVLSIDAANDTVRHYGDASAINIQAIASASYHEYGRILEKLSVSKGHIVVEQLGVVPQVNVVSATGAVKVTANAETTISVDSTSSAQTTIVANVDDVFVDGVDSSSISGNVKTPEGVATEAELRAANGGYAKLTADIVITTDQPISVSEKAVLDLNGHNITFGSGIGDETELYNIGKGGYLTICGTGKITANARICYVSGELRVEGGTFVTTVLANKASLRSSIISEENSKVLINGGDFYTAKANIYSFGELTINGGSFTSVANAGLSNKTVSANCSDCYAYSILVSGKTTINGGSFFGIHGGISHEGGQLVINNASIKVGQEAVTRYAAVQTTAHYLDTETTVDISAHTASRNNMYYALYAAGENLLVTCTINGGEFINEGKLYAVLVGNSTYGDGGKRLPALITISGGTFISAEDCKDNASIKINKDLGTAQISGGTFNKEKVNVDSTVKNLADCSNILVSGCRVVNNGDGTWTVVAD